MRGPGLRIQNDVRRLWRCPKCSYERKVPATLTSVDCSCADPRPKMQLIEPRRQLRPEPQPVDQYLEFDLNSPPPEEASDSALPEPPEPTPLLLEELPTPLEDEDSSPLT